MAIKWELPANSISIHIGHTHKKVLAFLSPEVRARIDFDSKAIKRNVEEARQRAIYHSKMGAGRASSGEIEASAVDTTFRLECINHCSRKFESARLFLIHCSVHRFRSELICTGVENQWIERVDGTYRCNLCRETNPDFRCKRQVDLAKHIGSRHGKVLQFLDEVTRKMVMKVTGEKAAKKGRPDVTGCSEASETVSMDASSNNLCTEIAKPKEDHELNCKICQKSLASVACLRSPSAQPF